MEINWKEIYARIEDWLITRGPSIILAIVIFIAGIFVIRGLNKWVKKALQGKRVNPSIRYFLLNLFAITLQILLVVISLQIAGFKLTLFSAILAGLTVAAGLALSGTLQNFVSGILILYLKPYIVGDNIITQGQEGTVTSIQLFSTIILTYDNRMVMVPNGQLSNSMVINLSRQGLRRMDIDLVFDHTIDPGTSKKILLDALRDIEHVLTEPAIRIGVSLIDKQQYTITMNIWTKAHGFYDTKLLVNEKLLSALHIINKPAPTS